MEMRRMGKQGAPKVQTVELHIWNEQRTDSRVPFPGMQRYSPEDIQQPVRDHGLQQLPFLLTPQLQHCIRQITVNALPCLFQRMMPQAIMTGDRTQWAAFLSCNCVWQGVCWCE